jgi:adenosylcobinamide-GDP ribazoletransferase
MMKGIKNVLGFLTIIPVGGDAKLEEVTRYAWLFPVVGASIGLISASVEYLASIHFSAFISSAFALLALLILTGFHHLDGLLDLGDALMHTGSPESRREVMHDVNIGVGGFALGFFVLLITYLAIVEAYSPFTSLIVAETSAKFSMVMGSYVGRPSHEGMGSAFTKAVDLKLTLLSILIYLLLVLPLLEITLAVAVISVTIISSLAIVGLSNRLLQGVCGDVFGAMNEIVRMITLLVMV